MFSVWTCLRYDCAHTDVHKLTILSTILICKLYDTEWHITGHLSQSGCRWLPVFTRSNLAHAHNSHDHWTSNVHDIEFGQHWIPLCSVKIPRCNKSTGGIRTLARRFAPARGLSRSFSDAWAHACTNICAHRIRVKKSATVLFQKGVERNILIKTDIDQRFSHLFIQRLITATNCNSCKLFYIASCHGFFNKGVVNFTTGFNF